MHVHLLREWRVAAGLTQVQVAERLGVTQAAISHIETGGNPSVDLLRKLVSLYGVPPEQAGRLLAPAAAEAQDP